MGNATPPQPRIHGPEFVRTQSAALETCEEICPVCEIGTSLFHGQVDGYDYFHCQSCSSLHISREVLKAIDAGKGTRAYDGAYWAAELVAARERASGESLVRAGEAILYAQRPIRRFLDVGTGPGFLL